MSLDLRKRLFDQLDKIVLVDPHTHINPLDPASHTLADILGYHYYTELAHSAGMPKEHGTDTANLTEVQLQRAISGAIADLGAGGFEVSGLGHVQFHVVDLPGLLLGWTAQNTIWIDQNAAGYGWSTDVSPSSNASFLKVTGTNEALAAPGSPANGHVDLLTVVTHELGHVLGFASIDPGIRDHHWMTATLGTGVRRYPDATAEAERPSALDAQMPAVASQGSAGGTGVLGSASPAVMASLGDPFALGPQEGVGPHLPRSGVEQAGAMTALHAHSAAVFVGLPGPRPNPFLSALLEERSLDLPRPSGPGHK